MNDSANLPLELKKYLKIIICFFGSIVVILLVVVSVVLVFSNYITYLDEQKILRRSMPSVNNLRNIGLGVVNYSSGTTQHILPLGASTNQEGDPLHGWMTSILPFIDEVQLSKQINYDKPWSDPENKNVFQTKIPVFINPKVGNQTTDSKGYYLTHYTANSRLMRMNRSYSLDEIAATDGIANTILLGEINSNFPAWGSTSNFRDPAKGLQGGPDQFGSLNSGSVNVLFVDGRAVSLSKDIDPQVLKALSTPNGGEKISHKNY